MAELTLHRSYSFFLARMTLPIIRQNTFTIQISDVNLDQKWVAVTTDNLLDHIFPLLCFLVFLVLHLVSFCHVKEPTKEARLAMTQQQGLRHPVTQNLLWSALG